MSVDPSVELFERFYTQDHPALGQGPVSVEPYISERYFAGERERIFRKSWLLFCHGADIPNSGDYLVKNIEVFGASIIVVRDSSGALRAFHNVCRHRGNKLVYEEGRGSSKAFVCGMHGWAYGLDGRLRGIPEQDRFFNLDKKTCGLVSFTMDTWNGFVFIHYERQPEQTLKAYLGTLGDALEGYPFGQMRLAADWTTFIKANWKVALNAFQESYHVATVHRTVLPSLGTGRTTPATRLSYFRFHGNHRSMTVPKNPDFTPSPTEALAGAFSAGLSQKVGAAPAMENWPGINPGGDPNFAFDINVVFPNNCIDVAQGWYFTYEFWPVSVNETRFVTKLYFDKPKTWSQRIGQELTIVQIREGLLEDATSLEATQEGLASGAIQQVVLSDQELAIRHQHHIIDAIVGAT